MLGRILNGWFEAAIVEVFADRIAAINGCALQKIAIASSSIDACRSR
jgi:hypothetical protein